MKKKHLEIRTNRGSRNEYEAAAAIIGMLSAAKNAALLDYRDEYCVDSLEECENILRERYNINTALVSERNYDKSLSEIAIFIRMISYVSLEISEKLKDGHCSDVTEQCVRHLMVSHDLSHNDVYPSGMIFSNVH